MPEENVKNDSAFGNVTEVIKADGAGLTQVDVAKSIKRPQFVVSEIESGGRGVDRVGAGRVGEGLSETSEFLPALEKILFQTNVSRLESM